MFFNYKDNFPPVEPSEVVAHATPTVGRPETPWEITLERLHIGQENDLIHKQKVFCTNKW